MDSQQSTQHPLPAPTLYTLEAAALVLGASIVEVERLVEEGDLVMDRAITSQSVGELLKELEHAEMARDASSMDTGLARDPTFDEAVARMRARLAKFRATVVGAPRNAHEAEVHRKLDEGYLRLDAVVELDRALDGMMPPNEADILGRKVVLKKWNERADLFE